MPISLKKIIGTITGKVAFERTGENFDTIESAFNTLETIVDGKASNSVVAALQTDLAAHKAESASDDVHGLGYGGVFVTLNANQSIPSDLNTVLVFNSVSRQSKYVFWDSNNPTRVTIPVGVNKVRLVAQVAWEHNDAGRREAAILKNGSPLNIPRAIDAKNAVLANMTISGMSTPLAIVINEINVSEGDFFELQVKQTSGTALSVMMTGRVTYLALEVIE